jgi:putative flippase GtrA
MTLQTLIVRYASFAVIATLANLAAQRIVLAYDSSAIGLAVAVGAGTITGLVIKYLLDKRWIFYDISPDLKANGRKFTVYAATGVFTTLVFWGFETAFWLYWRTDLMRELGAIVGLSIGYVLKYNLDKRYVFTRGGAALAKSGE